MSRYWRKYNQKIIFDANDIFLSVNDIGFRASL